ncbi:MAG TPA: chloride channel protein [Solirubrobacteraceae bacterium]|nr:chloride channel protein [Solirubrobacteraceae bacterium]
MSTGELPRDPGPQRVIDRRWFSHQPNVTGAGLIAAYSPRFWGLVVVLGVVAGVGGGLLMLLLRAVEHLSFGSHGHTLLETVSAAPGWRHILVLVLAALIVVVGLRVLGRLPIGGTEVSESLWLSSGRLNFFPSIARGLLSIITVGMGVSLGREAAPQLVGAATGSWLATWAELPVWQRRLLVASGAGAGFAAVYNVPLGGTLLALEVFLGTVALPLVLPALLTSVVATAVAWTMLGSGPTYHVSAYGFHASQLVWAVVLGPVIGLAATGWTRVVNAANRFRPRGGHHPLFPLAVFAALGALSIPYPQLLGNGKDIVQITVAGEISLGLVAVLLVLKPLVTSACMSTGSPGGLFTPTLAVGVLLAGVAGGIWSHIWGGAPVGSYAVIGGGAFLAAAMQGPMAGAVLMLELTRHFDALMVPMLLAVVEATIVSRRLGAQSIYSARLKEDPSTQVNPAAGAAAVATLYALDDALPPDLTRPPRRPDSGGKGKGSGRGRRREAGAAPEPSAGAERAPLGAEPPAGAERAPRPRRPRMR